MHQLIVVAALIHGGGMPPAQPEPLHVPTLNGLVEALETSYPLTADKVNAMFFAKRGRLATVREHWLAKHRLGERCTDDMLEAFVADPDAISFGVPKFLFTPNDDSAWPRLHFFFQSSRFSPFGIPTFCFPTCKPGFDSLSDVLYVSEGGQYWPTFARRIFWNWWSVAGVDPTSFPVYGPEGRVSGYSVYEPVGPPPPSFWLQKGHSGFIQTGHSGFTMASTYFAITKQSGLYFSDGLSYSVRPYRFEHWGYHDFALNSQFVAPTPWFPPGSSVPVPRVDTVRGARDTREISNGGWSYQRMTNPFMDKR